MSESIKLTAASLLGSPEWHLFNLTLRERKFRFVAMKEEDYHETVFLDSRMEDSKRPSYSLGFAETIKLFLRAGPPPATVSWIFHIGHCGSTLLSRALDVSNAVLPLREPKTLNLLSDIRREVGDPVCMFDEETFIRLRDAIIFALSRTFRPGQCPVVKATSTCNNLIRPLLEGAAGSQAILLYQPLEQYLTGRFRTPLAAKDLIAQARDRMLDWLRIPGAPRLFNARLAQHQLAVLAWITSMNYLLEAQRELPERTCLVDFEKFLMEPGLQLPALATFLRMDAPAEALNANYERISKQYSKSPEVPYSPEKRRQTLNVIRENEEKRITRGMQWAEQLIREVPALEPLGPYLQ